MILAFIISTINVDSTYSKQEQNKNYKTSTNWSPLYPVASNPIRKNKLDLFSMNERATTTATATAATTTTATETKFLGNSLSENLIKNQPLSHNYFMLLKIV